MDFVVAAAPVAHAADVVHGAVDDGCESAACTQLSRLVDTSTIIVFQTPETMTVSDVLDLVQDGTVSGCKLALVDYPKILSVVKSIKAEKWIVKLDSEQSHGALEIIAAINSNTPYTAGFKSVKTMKHAAEVLAKPLDEFASVRRPSKAISQQQYQQYQQYPQNYQPLQTYNKNNTESTRVSRRHESRSRSRSRNRSRSRSRTRDQHRTNHSRHTDEDNYERNHKYNHNNRDKKTKDNESHGYSGFNSHSGNHHVQKTGYALQATQATYASHVGNADYSSQNSYPSQFAYPSQGNYASQGNYVSQGGYPSHDDYPSQGVNASQVGYSSQGAGYSSESAEYLTQNQALKKYHVDQHSMKGRSAMQNDEYQYVSGIDPYQAKSGNSQHHYSQPKITRSSKPRSRSRSRST